MPAASANGIRIEYETFGRSSDRPLLLVMGLGAQMVLWDEAFCEELAGRGHFVVRYDNRDVGLSTKFDERGTPNVLELMRRRLAGEPVEAPYTLDDMADDAAGLLDALGLASAHVCGASMGGMIAQTLAIRHPARLRSLEPQASGGSARRRSHRFGRVTRLGSTSSADLAGLHGASFLQGAAGREAEDHGPAGVVAIRR